MIEILSNISLQRRDEFTFDHPWIIFNNRNTGKVIDGAFLKCAIKWNDFYILLTTENTWDTSSIYVLFFDSEFCLLDSAGLGSFPNPAEVKFQIKKIIQPDSIVIAYDRLWKILFLPKKRILFPFISEPLGVVRQKSFSGHFLISRENPELL